MAFPNSDYPTSLDAVETRQDGVDIIYSDDFHYHDEQIRIFQQYIGISGELIGQGISGKGPSGLVSPVADGGTAVKLAARNDFTAGKLLSVGDDEDNSYSEKFYVDSDGNAFCAGSAVITENTMPSVDLASGYVELARGDVLVVEGEGGTPSKKVGELSFSGGDFTTVFFRAVVTPIFNQVGLVTVSLHDYGPSGGPVTEPRSVANLTTAISGGPQLLSVPLLVVSSNPLGNQILDTSRIYRVTFSLSGETSDAAYLGGSYFFTQGGSTGAVGVDPTAIHAGTAGEISVLSEKAAPIAGDVLLLEDSEDSYAKKKVQIGSISSGGGGAGGFQIIVGNALEGDTEADCDYLDTGNGAQLKAAIEANIASWGVEVYIRPGLYDFSLAGGPTSAITISAGASIRGSEREQVYIRTATTGDNGCFIFDADCRVQNITIQVPTPTGPCTATGVIRSTSGLRASIDLDNVEISFSDAGWSTLTDGLWNSMVAAVYFYTSTAYRRVCLRDVIFRSVPNEHTNTESVYLQACVYYPGDIDPEIENPWVFENVSFEGGWYGVDTVRNCRILNCSFFDQEKGAVTGTSTVHFMNNLVKKLTDNIDYWGVLFSGDYCVVAYNEFIIDKPALSEAVAISISGNCAFVIGNSGGDGDETIPNGGHGDVWPVGLELVGRNHYTAFNNFFGATVDVPLSSQSNNVSIYNGTDHIRLPEVWSLGNEDYYMEEPFEFALDPILSMPWIINLATGALGSFSASEVNSYDTGFTSGDIRLTVSPKEKFSWGLFQAPADGNEYAITIGAPLPSINLPFVISARLRTTQPIVPNANDGCVGIVFGMPNALGGFHLDKDFCIKLYLHRPSAGQDNVYLSRVFSGSETVIATFPSSIGQYEYCAFQMLSFFGMHAWVGTAAGDWTYVGYVSWAAMPIIGYTYGVLLQNSSVVGRPGVSVVGVDFIRSSAPNTADFRL